MFDKANHESALSRLKRRIGELELLIEPSSSSSKSARGPRAEASAAAAVPSDMKVQHKRERALEAVINGLEKINSTNTKIFIKILELIILIRLRSRI